MRGLNHREPPEERSRASKGKRSCDVQQIHINHSKRQRLIISKTETLTQKRHPSRNLPTSNRFEAIHSSSGAHKRQKRKKSSSRKGYRKWVSSSRDFSSYKDKVVVVSYNILGVENAKKHPDLYFKVPRKFLEWDWRKKLICEEISHYNANILCFQEVDRFNDLDDLLQKDGFRGIHKGRTGEAFDGCAMFWKDELFTLLHQENIEFKSFGLRDNVAQLCVLKMNQNRLESEFCTQTSMTTPIQSRSLLVGNIHVLFNPNRGDIKLGQVRLFLEKAYKLSQEWGGIPIIIAGDLNSSPQSAMYQFLTSSELDIQLHDRRKISSQVDCPSHCRDFRSQNKAARCSTSMSVLRPSYRWSDEELRLATGCEGITYLRHQLRLCSAYIGVPGSCRTRDNDGEPLATSYHSKFMGTVDYIWHTEELLPVRVLETLPIDILKSSAGLPSERWGSDHLALACELAFTDDGSRS